MFVLFVQAEVFAPYISIAVQSPAVLNSKLSTGKPGQWIKTFMIQKWQRINRQKAYATNAQVSAADI
jgi:hypothetical protein